MGIESLELHHEKGTTMQTFRVMRILFLVALAGLGLTLAACGESDSASPDNVLTVVITDDGQIRSPVQEIFTDKSPAMLRLSIVSHGSNMAMKVVSVMNITRTDHTGNMALGSVQMMRLDPSTYNLKLYGGDLNLLLPLGTYGFMIDGVPTGAVIKVSAKSPAPSATH